AFGEDLDAVAVDDHAIAVDFDGAGKLAVYRVVAGQVRVRFGFAEIVDGDDLDVVLLAAFIVRTKDIAADAAVTVDCDADGHLLLQKGFNSVSTAKHSFRCRNPAAAGPDRARHSRLRSVRGHPTKTVVRPATRHRVLRKTGARVCCRQDRKSTRLNSSHVK